MNGQKAATNELRGKQTESKNALIFKELEDPVTNFLTASERQKIVSVSAGFVPSFLFFWQGG